MKYHTSLVASVRFGRRLNFGHVTRQPIAIHFISEHVPAPRRAKIVPRVTFMHDIVRYYVVWWKKNACDERIFCALLYAKCEIGF